MVQNQLNATISTEYILIPFDLVARLVSFENNEQPGKKNTVFKILKIST